MTPVAAALDLRVRGVVQGVGFRPFVYRLAGRYGLTGWVRNGASGVLIHAEGPPDALDAFARAVAAEAPPAASVASLESTPGTLEGFDGFAIRASSGDEPLSARISPDLPVCEACLRELFDPADRRYGYPYITCTDCGPRYSIILGLPYDRPLTTMATWPMCAQCEAEYHDPGDRRFHAQPLACPECGPTYALREPADRRSAARPAMDRQAGGNRERMNADARGTAAIESAAAFLRGGVILAVKGLGGYHLACDAMNAGTVAALRERKYRKERPFALMVRDLAAARALVELERRS